MLKFLHSYPGDMSPGQVFDPGTAIAVGGSLVGGYLSSQSAKKSAKAGSKAASAAATSAENSLYQGARTVVNTEQPYTDAGTKATNALSDDLGISGNTNAAGYGSLATPFTSSDLPTNDGYQFQLKQGEAALQRSQAANGGLLSGAAAKGLDDYTQGLASTEYQNAYNNYNTNQTNLYSRLSGLSTTGANAANVVANAGYNANAGVAGIQSGLGTALAQNAAASITGSGNATQTGLANIGNTASNYLKSSGNNNFSFLSSLGS